MWFVWRRSCPAERLPSRKCWDWPGELLKVRMDWGIQPMAQSSAGLYAASSVAYTLAPPLGSPSPVRLRIVVRKPRSKVDFYYDAREHSKQQPKMALIRGRACPPAHSTPTLRANGICFTKTNKNKNKKMIGKGILTFLN